MTGLCPASFPILIALAMALAGAGPKIRIISEEGPASTTQPSAIDQQQLDTLVADYFRQPDDKARAKIGVDIAELVDGDVRPVAEALDRVQLWDPQPPGVQTFDLKTGKDRVTSVSVRIPAEYDQTKRYPLILGLHGQSGRGPHILHYLEYRLRQRVEEFIVAAPTDYKGMWFHTPPDEAGDPPALLAELRRRYHVDTERVYAVGYSMGGHGAFILAMFYTDEFAAAVPVAGTFVAPYSQATYPLVLPNVTNLPVLAVWGENDTGDDKRPVSPGGGIAGLNRQIDHLARVLNLPINAVELRGVGHSNVEPPLGLMTDFLEMRRDPNTREVQHWFRYPGQGRIGWLRQRRFAGQPWQGTQIAVVIDGPTDIYEYITDVLKKKLGYLGGTIDGQLIEADIRRTAELEVLLHDGLIDLDQPITLKVGDKIRYEGKVERKVSTMLQIAYEDWDFQRLFPVRLVMKARSKARQE